MHTTCLPCTALKNCRSTGPVLPGPSSIPLHSSNLFGVGGAGGAAAADGPAMPGGARGADGTAGSSGAGGGGIYAKGRYFFRVIMASPLACGVCGEPSPHSPTSASTRSGARSVGGSTLQSAVEPSLRRMLLGRR